MSALISLAQEVSLQAATIAPISVQADGGILDKATTLNSDIQTLVRAVAITLGIIFVIVAAVASRGGLARIFIAALAAGAFIYIVFNITQVKDMVGNDLAAAPAIVQVLDEPPVALANPTR